LRQLESWRNGTFDAATSGSELGSTFPVRTAGRRDLRREAGADIRGGRHQSSALAGSSYVRRFFREWKPATFAINHRLTGRFGRDERSSKPGRWQIQELNQRAFTRFVAFERVQTGGRFRIGCERNF